MIRRASPLPFVLFAVLSSLFMIWTLDSFEFGPVQFVGRIVLGAGIALAIELVILALIGRSSPLTISRSRWLRDYLVPSLGGSAALIVWFEAVGLTQDRATFIFALVFLTRAVNIWLLAFILDQIASYREQVLTTRAELLPALMTTREMNSLVQNATRIRDHHEVELVRNDVWSPLMQLTAAADRHSNEELATSIEEFIDDSLRPLAHNLHPVTLRRGIIPALQSLGFAVSADAALHSLDTTGKLVDAAALREVFRWLQDSSASGDRQVTIEIERRIDGVSFRIHGAQAGVLDALHQVAGLRSLDDTTVVVHESASTISTSKTPNLGAAPSSASFRRTLIDDWRWSVGSTHPPLVLILALTAGAIPSIAFIASPRVVATSFVAPVGWIVVPLLLTLALRMLPSGGNGRLATLRFCCVWLGLGLASGLLVSTLDLAFVPGTGTEIIWQETLRGLFRISILGGAVALTADLARNAQHLTAAVLRDLRITQQHRDSLLKQARIRSEFMAQLLHRTIQGRLAAIALLLHHGDRTRALQELDALTSQTLPHLLTKMTDEAQPATSMRSGFDVPLGVDVEITPEALHLAENSPLRDQIYEIVAEAAVNAHRHGKARSLRIELQDRDGSIELRMIDDGTGLDPALVPGLGSRLFDDAVGPNGTWALLREHDSTVAHFTLPKAAPVTT